MQWMEILSIKMEGLEKRNGPANALTSSKGNVI
jgi:hypothetical protein